MLYTNFYPDYLMGDTEYDYFSHKDFKPELVYYDYPDYNEYTDDRTLLEHGVQLISWDYPEPVENTFVFSHISYLSSEVVFPLLLIAVSALLAVMIFVKKETDFVRQRTDVISTVFNYLIALFAVPFLTIFACLSDINGSGPDLSHQIIYLIPAITVLSLAASVSLRRKDFRRSSLAVQFIGFALLALAIIMDPSL
jgi:cytochrome bd-type quinol oxidase subunit 2